MKQIFSNLLTEHKSSSVWRNLLFPADFLLIFLIWIYQKTLSTDHSWWGKKLALRVCRHHPSCSEYALQAISRFGALRGLLLALQRLGSCHPWSHRPANDPVPPR